MDVLTTKLNSMADAAREFCDLVDGFDALEREVWLERLAELLPRLLVAVTALEKQQIGNHFEPVPDYESRFEMFTRLYHGIGERDGYSTDFDTCDGQRLSGSLADDITDIYFDLKRGLELLQQHPAEPRLAAADWQSSFRLHWHHHLLDAESQLSGLVSTHS